VWRGDSPSSPHWGCLWNGRRDRGDHEAEEVTWAAPHPPAHSPFLLAQLQYAPGVTLPVIAGIVRVALTWTNGSGSPETVHNVLHFDGDTGDVTDLCTSFNSELDAVQDDALAALSSSYLLTSLTAIPLDGTSGGTTVSVGGVGGHATGDYIAQGCQVLSMYTGRRGPRGRGRMYLGPVGEVVQENGHVAVTALVFTTAWQQVFDNLSGLGADLVVASYAHADAHPVTSLAMHSPLFTQRRRALKT